MKILCGDWKKRYPWLYSGAGKFAKTLAYFLDRKGIKTDIFVVTGTQETSRSF